MVPAFTRLLRRLSPSPEPRSRGQGWLPIICQTQHYDIARSPHVIWTSCSDRNVDGVILIHSPRPETKQVVDVVERSSALRQFVFVDSAEVGTGSHIVADRNGPTGTRPRCISPSTGHSRIAYIAPPADSASNLLSHGYFGALAAANLASDDRLVAPVSDFSLEAGAKAATQLLLRGRPSHRHLLRRRHPGSRRHLRAPRAPAAGPSGRRRDGLRRDSVRSPGGPVAVDGPLAGGQARPRGDSHAAPGDSRRRTPATGDRCDRARHPRVLQLRDSLGEMIRDDLDEQFEERKGNQMRRAKHWSTALALHSDSSSRGGGLRWGRRGDLGPAAATARAGAEPAADPPAPAPEPAAEPPPPPEPAPEPPPPPGAGTRTAATARTGLGVAAAPLVPERPVHGIVRRPGEGILRRRGLGRDDQSGRIRREQHPPLVAAGSDTFGLHDTNSLLFAARRGHPPHHRRHVLPQAPGGCHGARRLRHRDPRGLRGPEDRLRRGRTVANSPRPCLRRTAST